MQRLAVATITLTAAFATMTSAPRARAQAGDSGRDIDVHVDADADADADVASAVDVTLEFQRTARAAEPREDAWRTGGVGLGLSGDRLWMRLAVTNRAAAPRALLLRPQGPLVEEAALNHRGATVRAGERIERGAWPVPGRHVALPMALAGNETTTALVWMEGERGLSTRFELITREEAARRDARAAILLGLALGAMLGLVLYNAAVAALTRRAHHVYQVTSSACITAWLAGSTGAAQLLIGSIPDGVLAALHVVALLAAVAMARRLFALRERAPRAERAARGAMVTLGAFFVVAWPLLPASLYHQLFGLLFFVAQGALVAFGALAWRRGDATARVYVLTWLPVILVALPGAVAAAGAAPAWLLDVVPMAAGLVWVGGQSLTLAFHYRAERARTQALLEASQRFVPREFLDILGRGAIDEVSAGDQKVRTMTVFFSDLRSFTRLVEGQSPDENMRFINRYLSAMEEPIRAHRGFVDSYVGDAIMALFTDADDAVHAAIADLRALRALNVERAESGKEALITGIGLSTGELMLGTIGSATRIKCGVIGDPVNTAARTETMTKQYGALLLITGSTKRALRDVTYLMRHIDDVIAVGKSEPVEIWEVLDGYSDDELAVRTASAHAAALGTALAHYRRGAIAEASDALTTCDARDPLVPLYRDRCAQLRERGVPPDWRGVWRLDRK